MMKRFIFSLTLLTFCVFAAQAQTGGVGLKAGVNLASIGGKNYNAKTRAGYHFGLMGAVGIAPGVLLQPELQFSLQGEGVKDAGEALHLTYLHIPVMAKVALGDPKLFNIQFGPYGSFRVGTPKGGDVGIRESINSFDAGVGLGLGFGGAKGLTVDARYLYGLTAASNDPQFEGAGNRLLQLSLGYFFGGSN